MSHMQTKSVKVSKIRTTCNEKKWLYIPMWSVWLLNKKSQAAILYYKIQSVCVCVCVSMLVCLYVGPE